MASTWGGDQALPEEPLGRWEGVALPVGVQGCLRLPGECSRGGGGGPVPLGLTAGTNRCASAQPLSSVTL